MRWPKSGISQFKTLDRVTKYNIYHSGGNNAEQNWIHSYRETDEVRYEIETDQLANLLCQDFRYDQILQLQNLINVYAGK